MHHNRLKGGVSFIAFIAVPLAISVPALAVEDLPDISIEASAIRAGSEAEALQTPPIVEKLQLPQTAASATATKIEQQVNAVDAGDTVKYLPSLFLRKRNNGDTQPVLATRTWGVNSSARSLVYADDLLLTALIANNNTIGAPRWGLVTPEEIARVDVLYGPFAAAYPGNSMGAIMQMTTRMPDKPVATIKQTEAFQTFDTYGTKGTYRTDQTSVALGNRVEGLSWLVTANYANSFSQPLSWITVTQAQTTALAAANVAGVIPALNKTGGVANVVGAGGLLHTQMVNTKLKLAYDFNSWLSATYMLGFWSNSGSSKTETYLRTASGVPTYGQLTGSNAIGGFATNNYKLDAKHVANAFALRTDTRGEWDWEVSASRYDVAGDRQTSPYGLSSGSDAFSTLGKTARYDGTNWMLGDMKGFWRPGGRGGAHEVSFGVHADRYQLRNPTDQIPVWDSGVTSSDVKYSIGRGQTVTDALWAQDAWKVAPRWTLTTGLRFESWKASDGYNYAATANASTGVITGQAERVQPELSASHTSPKISLNHELNDHWNVIGSYGNASRFPTVAELYQTTTSGSNIVNPNPNLRPEIVDSAEIAIERKIDAGKIRLSFFHESTRDALISQTSTISGTTNTATFVDNVGRTKNQGVEIAAQKDDILIEGFQLSGSVTYVDSRIVSDPSWRGTTTVVGKHVPYVPDWRATLSAIYKPSDHWSVAVAGRYSGKMYSTLDNSDTVGHVFGAFDTFVVLDTRIQYKVSDRTTLSLGVDNLTNAKYDLYHPFPGRTVFLDAKFSF